MSERRSHIDDKIEALMHAGRQRPKGPPTSGGPDGCTNKDKYPTEAAARASALSNGTVEKLLAYRCDRCEYWHLTRRHKG